jgi:hypothetical protein
LVVCRAGWHEDLLAQQPNLVVPGKRTVLNVEPCVMGLAIGTTILLENAIESIMSQSSMPMISTETH